MATDYNSKLISRLYNAVEFEEYQYILREMGEISDPIFVYPLMDAYRKCSEETFGHYFISALKSIKSAEAVATAEAFIQDQDTRADHIPWFLDVLSENDNFENEEIKKRAVAAFESFFSNRLAEDQPENEYTYSFYLGYLKKAGAIESVKDLLLQIFEHEKTNADEKAIALRYYIGINPQESYTKLAEDYLTKIKNSESEIVLAKILKDWSKGAAETLKELIIKQGQSRAKEIIEKEQLREKEKNVAQQSREQKLLNLDEILKIREVRLRINEISKAEFGFTFFLETELLIEQLKLPTDELSFKHSCLNLRSIVKSLSNDFRNHGLSAEDIKKILPETKPDDYAKPLNSFHIFSESKQLDCKTKFQEIKRLNWLLGALGAHAESVGEAVKKLKSDYPAAFSLFKEKNWPKLHNFLLIEYRKFLEGIDELLSKQKKGEGV